MPEAIRYLGDGAYAKLEAGVLVLYTSNGVREENHIYLENAECIALIVHILDTGIVTKNQVQHILNSI